MPTKNIDPKLVILNDQKRKIIDLEKELKQANMHIQNLSLLNNDKDNIIEKLQKKLQKQTQLAQATQQKLDKAMAEPKEPTSPTSPAALSRQLTNQNQTTLPDISGKNATGRNGNDSILDRNNLGGAISPNKTTQNGFLLPGVNPASTLLGGVPPGNLARMAATGTAFYEKQKADAQAEVAHTSEADHVALAGFPMGHGG